MKKIELLAPAKDLDTGIAAIKYGADAVYIGAPSFGARYNASNSLEDIEKLILFAHKYWAKVYITLNTILDNQEIPKAYDLIKKLYEIGADAIIIQDMGLLEFDLPPVPLFASTQTHNNNWKKVKFLEKIGFQRVILARELSIEQIKEISSNTNIELESFIHGSLCVGYSGQCYMSYAIGGRSGNRGTCAQPCRKIYSLQDTSGKFISKDKYLLSLKDLNMSNYIKDLIYSGISSFKIEGRLKDINYVKNIVSFYRNEIDKVLNNLNKSGLSYKKSSSGIYSYDFTPDPYKTFNRGYTSYLITGKQESITSIHTPKSLGEPIGTTYDIKEKTFRIKSDIQLNNGDGICFFDRDKSLKGTTINKVINNLIDPNSMEAIDNGTMIYRNSDHEFIKALKKSATERKIQIKLKLYQKDNNIVLQSIDEDNIRAEYQENIEFDQARDKEAALFNLKKQLIKLGDSEFVANDIEIELKTIYFIPIKTLNEMRRNLVERLKTERVKQYPISTYKLIKNKYAYPDDKISYLGNVYNSYAETFYKRHGVQDIELAPESGIDMQDKVIMTTKHCLKRQFNLCSKQNILSAYKDPFYLIDDKGKKYRLNFDCKNCEMQVIYTDIYI